MLHAEHGVQCHISPVQDFTSSVKPICRAKMMNTKMNDENVLLPLHMILAVCKEKGFAVFCFYCFRNSDHFKSGFTVKPWPVANSSYK